MDIKDTLNPWISEDASMSSFLFSIGFIFSVDFDFGLASVTNEYALISSLKSPARDQTPALV